MKIFNFLRESNRMSHLIAGFLIYFATLLLAGLFSLVTENAVAMVIFLSALCVFFSMFTCEYIQDANGIGRFDWLDVLAGCIPPIVISVVSFIIMLL